MLKVNEIFGPTMQGEGKSAGMPCSFLRLAQCNLHCVWCDTPYTWNWIGTNFAHPKKFVKQNEVYQMRDDEIIIKLQSIGVKTLVISGGEPLLQHKQLVSLCQKLKEFGYWIEIETNGTIFPNQNLINFVDQINCSPKLSNSLDSRKLRIRNEILSQLAICQKVNFKFVISQPKDIIEVITLVNDFHLKEVRLMPNSQTKEELIEKSSWVRQLCEEYDFIFCTRLSILTAGTTRGV